MPLESLLELVQTLRQRIKEHRSALSGNEMLTRYALIDPLLSELGWETTDPATVIPEDTSGLGRGRPDYVLQHSGKPVMVIEAKKLGSGLQDGARQAISYAMDANRQARYFALTDGQNWKIYDTNRPASDMRAASFDIMAASPAEVCLKAMALWRPAVEHGSVMAAETPIVGLDVVKQAAPKPGDLPSHEPEPTPQEQPATRRPPATATQSSETSQGWIPLSELQPKLRSTPPVEILFPDGSSTRLGRWNLIMVESVRWLLANNFLSRGQFPIKQGKRYLIADNPVHSTGTRFHQAKQVGEYFLEASYNADYQVRNANKVINLAGQDPSQFKVRLPS